MRNRLWFELTQAKFNDRYVSLLIGHQREVLNFFNMLIAAFSTAGIMGWQFWDKLPVVACGIIAIISLAKLIQPHIVPSEKQIEKLDKIADFYFNFYLQLEKIWFDFENNRITEVDLQNQFLILKQGEREINSLVNEVHKKGHKKIIKKAKTECDNFFNQSFKI